MQRRIKLMIKLVAGLNRVLAALGTWCFNPERIVYGLDEAKAEGASACVSSCGATGAFSVLGT